MVNLPDFHEGLPTLIRVQCVDSQFCITARMNEEDSCLFGFDVNNIFPTAAHDSWFALLIMETQSK
jgi:hypothetical protein